MSLTSGRTNFDRVDDIMNRASPFSSNERWVSANRFLKPQVGLHKRSRSHVFLTTKRVMKMDRRIWLWKLPIDLLNTNLVAASYVAIHEATLCHAESFFDFPFHLNS